MQFKNSHNRIVRKLLPRFSPTWLGDDPAATPPPSGQGTSAVGPPAAVTLDPQPTPTPTPAAPSPSPTPVATPSSQSAPAPAPATSSSQATSNAASSSSAVPASSSTDSSATSSSPSQSAQGTTGSSSSSVHTSADQPTTAPPSLSPRPNAATRTFTNASGVVVTSMVTVEPSATGSPKPSNTGTILGGIAGALVALACLAAFVSWIIRQRKKHNRDDFDRNSYLRNSVAIPDDPHTGQRGMIGSQHALAHAFAPRPPSMLERKPTYMMHNESYAPGQVLSFEPGQIVSAPPSASVGYPSPVPFTAYTPPASHLQTELARRPSGAMHLVRQPTNGGTYDQVPSPVGYSPASYNSHEGYTYPMYPNQDRVAIQSVTPYQAQQYAEIQRQLDIPSDQSHESFLAMSSNEPSPVGYAISTDPETDKALPNPFDDTKNRVDSIPPSLPPVVIENDNLSRTGTPIDPNPQHAHLSYSSTPDKRLSVAGMLTVPPTAHTREEKTVVVGNGEQMSNAQRPVSVVDEHDLYGGM